MSIKSPDEIDAHIGKMIRAQRLAGGLSQENLAESIGLTFQQIQKYEKGVIEQTAA
jgi:transcriptional regulator with XRE-family HTH domain